jgi:tripartite-type tricarboxylate transporter receptor subunit TctC
LLSGEVGMIFGEPASMIGFLKTGKLRALAVTSGKRALSLPELPTMAEAGVADYDVTSWNGILAPAATPREIVGRLHQELVKILAVGAVKEQASKLGMEIVGSSPEEYATFLRAENEKWGKMVKNLKLRAN